MATKKAAKKQPAKKVAAKKAAKAKPRQSLTSAQKPVAAESDPKPRTLSARAQHFAREYLIDFNGARAARAAGYEPANARTQASELLQDPRIKAMVAEEAAKHSAKAEATVDSVLDRLWAGANADAREFSEIFRVACRHCYGIGHRYQYTLGEMEEAKREWLKTVDRDEAGTPREKFDERGGLGYSPKRDPAPDCPDCHGDGIERVILKDTRDLSPNAVKLYAGVKQTQHGIEVRQHDPVQMLRDVGKELGMFASRLRLGAKGNEPDDDDDDVAGYVLMPMKKTHNPTNGAS